MDLKQRVQVIVEKATVLKDKYEIGKNIPKAISFRTDLIAFVYTRK